MDYVTKLKKKSNSITFFFKIYVKMDSTRSNALKLQNFYKPQIEDSA